MVFKYLCLLFFCLVFNSSAQNLVPNGSFEQYYSCPVFNGEADTCIGWHSFGGIIGATGTPDYFNSCSILVGVPDNLCGRQMAYQGNAYMGLFTRDYSYWYREIIGTQLLDTLIPGENYHISMRICHGNSTSQVETCFATNKMGIKFTTYNIPYGTIIPIDNSPQLYSDSIVTDTVDWVLLSWDFIPDSSYSNIYIGNFFETDSTDTVSFNCMGFHAYYFIDSVNVACESEQCILTSNELNRDDLKLIYDANQNIIRLTQNLNSHCSLTIYRENGDVVMTDEGNRNIYTNISSLIPGFYLAFLQSEKQVFQLKIVKL
jgi:OOP family OmpA-OmpF porin